MFLEVGIDFTPEVLWLAMLRPLGFLFFIVLSLIPRHAAYAQHTRALREPIVIQVIHLDYADAEHLASVLAPLLSKDGRVVAYSPTNSLIIKDRASLVKKLVKIIKGVPDP
jgi:type II secretory pathway component GspD/PulD (secretin)